MPVSIGRNAKLLLSRGGLMDSVDYWYMTPVGKL